MDVSILPNQPWLISQHSGMSPSQKHYYNSGTWQHSFPHSKTCCCFTHFSFKPRGTELPLQECTHAQSLPSGLSLSKVKQMSLWTSQQHIPRGKKKHKPVCAARVASDSSSKTPGAICHCLSLLNTAALVFSTYCRKLKGITSLISLRKKWQDAAACSQQPHKHAFSLLY